MSSGRAPTRRGGEKNATTVQRPADHSEQQQTSLLSLSLSSASVSASASSSTRSTTSNRGVSARPSTSLPSMPSASSQQATTTNIPQLCCAFLAAMTTGGTTYAFGLYGSALKKALLLSQSQLDTISTFFFCAGLLSWIPGMCVDKLGTRLSLASGGVIGATSLMVYWAVSKSILILPDKEMIVAALSFLGVMIFLSCALITGSVFKIIVSNCGPGSKGSAVGAAKGYVGLGAGAYACLFEAIRSPTSSDLDFLPMAAFFFIVAATIPSIILLTPEKKIKVRRININATTITNDSNNAHVQLEQNNDNNRNEQGMVDEVPNINFDNEGGQTQSQPSTPTKVRDATTPLHFKMLYGSLITMAVVVVGTSLLTLYSDHDNNKSHTNTKTTHEPNYGLALLVVTIWMGPILGWLCLPHKSLSADIDNGDAMITREEGNALLGSASDDGDDDDDDHNHNQEKSGHDEEINVKRQSKAIAKRSTSLSSESDNNNNNNNRSDVQRLGLISNQERGNESNDEENIDGDNDDDDDNRVRDNNNNNINRSPTASNRNDNTDKNLIEMLLTPSAMLMLWTTTILVGGGTVETNNMGQMVESLGFPDSVTPASLALFSVAQSAGRVITGAVSEVALSWNIHGCVIERGIPRPFFLIVASLLAFVAHLSLAFTTNVGTFVIGVAVSGAAFGMAWPLMVLIVGEVYGMTHYGGNYMFFDGFTSAGGTFLLTKVIAQYVYERHIDDSDHSSDGVTCYGTACFQGSHVAVAILSLSCIFTSLAMMYTSKRAYNKSNLHTH